MPENKKRPGHPYRKPSDIPARERVKGKTFWAILLGVFGLIIAYFAVGTNYLILAIATLAGGIIGYFLGKKMEKGK